MVSTAQLEQVGVLEPGWTLKPVPGGTSGTAFQALDAAGRPRLVVRSGERLAYVAQVLHDLALTPAAQNLPTGVRLIGDDGLVHDWVQGQPRQLDDNALETLGFAVAGIHRLQVDGYVHWPATTIRQGTRADLFRLRIKDLARYGIDAEHDIKRLRTVPLPTSDGWSETDFSQLHGDLSAGNILWQGARPIFIDWDYARAGDPAEDLANLVVEHGLSPEQVATFAEGYIDNDGDPWAFARLQTWVAFVALDNALWWQAHAPDSPAAGARFAFARTLLPD